MTRDCPLRILLVEDNDTNRLIASRMVKRMGHQVDAIADGAQAVQAVRSGAYDVILMDLMMPVMDGLTATRLIRQEPGGVGRTPIVGLTANIAPDREASWRDAGMSALASKPMTAERLAAAIESVLPASDAEALALVWPLLDEGVLQRLCHDIGKDGAGEVVKLFLTEAPCLIDRLEQSCGRRGGRLLRDVHTLASSARSVGLLRIGHVAAEIERAMAYAEPSEERLSRLLDLLRQSVMRLAEWDAAQGVT